MSSMYISGIGSGEYVIGTPPTRRAARYVRWLQDEDVRKMYKVVRYALVALCILLTGVFSGVASSQLHHHGLGGTWTNIVFPIVIGCAGGGVASRIIRNGRPERQIGKRLKRVAYLVDHGHTVSLSDERLVDLSGARQSASYLPVNEVVATWLDAHEADKPLIDQFLCDTWVNLVPKVLSDKPDSSDDEVKKAADDLSVRYWEVVHAYQDLIRCAELDRANAEVTIELDPREEWLARARALRDLL